MKLKQSTVKILTALKMGYLRKNVCLSQYYVFVLQNLCNVKFTYPKQCEKCDREVIHINGRSFIYQIFHFLYFSIDLKKIGLYPFLYNCKKKLQCVQ